MSENDDVPVSDTDSDTAMGAVRGSDRLDPITGKPLVDPEEAREPNPSSNIAGDAYRHPAEKGIEEESKGPITGQPSSTPRSEPGLRDL